MKSVAVRARVFSTGLCVRITYRILKIAIAYSSPRILKNTSECMGWGKIILYIPYLCSLWCVTLVVTKVLAKI